MCVHTPLMFERYYTEGRYGIQSLILIEKVKY